MDGGLLELFRRGDRSALGQLYSLYARDVESRVRAVLASLGRLTPENLADLVQESFLRAFSDRARAQYDSQREYGPFLITIAQNVVIDWSRRSCREVPEPDILQLFSQQVSHEMETAPFDPTLLAKTEAYVAGLPPDMRAVHQVRFVRGMPQRQAAEAIGISRQSLRTLERKLLCGFRQHLRKVAVVEGAPRSSHVTVDHPSVATPKGRLTVARRR